MYLSEEDKNRLEKADNKNKKRYIPLSEAPKYCEIDRKFLLNVIDECLPNNKVYSVCISKAITLKQQDLIKLKESK